MLANSKENVLQALNRELPLLYRCVDQAWKTYAEYPAEHRVAHSSRSRASLVHDHATVFAREIFDVRIGSKCQEIRKLFLVCFDNGIVVRFKKLDEQFRASNIRTQQCLQFMDQMSLPAVDAAVNLHVGYRLNELQTDLEGIYLTCPSGPAQNNWVHLLDAATYGTNRVSEINPSRTREQAKKAVKFAPRKQDRGNEQASQ